MGLTENLQRLTNEELISLSSELSMTTVPENSLLRKVIQGTVHDSELPVLAFMAVQGTLTFVLTERLIAAENTIRNLEKRYGNERPWNPIQE